MITLKTKLEFNKFSAISAQMIAGAQAAVAKTTADVYQISRASMQGPKSGKAYSRPGGKIHRASAPGEAPAIDTSVLVNSIQVEIDGLHGYVYTNTEYAPILEFGGAKMAKRPFFGPAAQQAWPGFEAAMRQIFGVGNA